MLTTWKGFSRIEAEPFLHRSFFPGFSLIVQDHTSRKRGTLTRHVAGLPAPSQSRTTIP